MNRQDTALREVVKMEGKAVFLKNASELHDHFVKDAGFQYYILKRCHVPVSRVYIVLHGPDEANPFLPVDVTAEAKGLYNWINDNIWDLNRMQKGQEEVQVEPGECCTKPYECWYCAYCHTEPTRIETLE